MIKNLTPIGDRLALIIDQQLLDLLQIDRETPLEVIVQGRALHVRPLENDHQTRVLEAADRVMDLHEETLRKLAL
jgi:hypothetical protein